MPLNRIRLIAKILSDADEIQNVNDTITGYIRFGIHSTETLSDENEVRDVHNTISVYVMRVRFSWQIGTYQFEEQLVAVLILDGAYIWC